MMYMSKFIYGAGRLSVSWAPETPDMRPGVLSHHHLMVCIWDAGGGGEGSQLRNKERASKRLGPTSANSTTPRGGCSTMKPPLPFMILQPLKGV